MIYDQADTGELEVVRPTVREQMRAQPGAMLMFAGEWALIALMALGFLMLTFLFCFAGFVLVARVPA